ncbi:MotA/TolQ/ExbB proton channel family protein [Leptospira ognonensis]|uniref:MotA/TolQ/ExbB proton channel family protein n=1 Tax=Leptospira ognonensis TaxID=2484945 RepID=A0A4R9JU22_9LEPT|nr:MotA/TolQ/ExbB proton channel family protein [Leptospira ognonensis]TGL56272.1 MotA/TolQ/ExbB proton channel family protein [Leptospira ognonensis]
MNFPVKKTAVKYSVVFIIVLVAIFTIAKPITAQTTPDPQNNSTTETQTPSETKTETPAPVAKESEIGLVKLFNTGGWSMWPLLLSSIVALGVIFERIYFFSRTKLMRKGFNQDLEDAITGGGLKGVEDFLSQNTDQKITDVLKNGMEVSQNDPEIFASGVEREASEVITLLEKGLTVLAAVSTIAPLVGFLGTVSGMINAFDAIANADSVNAKVVAGGIKEALITTAAGLIVAIPAMVFYQYLQGRVASFISEVEESANKIYKEYLKVKAGKKAV